MTEKGLAVASEEITTAPTMYREEEQGEDVARGCVKVVEVIAYDATKEPMRYFPEKEGMLGEIKKKDGQILYVEKGRAPYFCQDPEDVTVFGANNPDVRVETFTIQLRKSTAIKYLDSPRNMEQFKEKS